MAGVQNPTSQIIVFDRGSSHCEDFRVLESRFTRWKEPANPFLTPDEQRHLFPEQNSAAANGIGNQHSLKSAETNEQIEPNNRQ